jgi:Putative peptidoglycan binding domain
MATLKKGDKGAAVRALQTRLATVTKIDVDGVFGDATETIIKALQRAAGLTDDGVVGPKTTAALDALLKEVPGAEKPEPAPAAKPGDKKFNDEGWYFGAKRWDVHPRRLGGAIKPAGVVDHTMDMAPGTMAALLRAWAKSPTTGAGAHFVLGRRPATADELVSLEAPGAGLVQIAPVYCNGNHAGGTPGHGWLQYPDGRKVHPNLKYIGIEIDCAGALQKNGGNYIHTSSGKIIPREDVFIDDKGRAWHKITDYQFEQIAKLHDALEAEVLEAFPAGTKIVPNGSYSLNGVTWAVTPGVRFVGHVTLDPIRKRDPGYQFMAWLKNRYPNG